MNDILLNSMADDVERLWIYIKYSQTTLSTGGVIYFTVDNVTAHYEDAYNLQNELIPNIGEIQHSCNIYIYNVVMD